MQLFSVEKLITFPPFHQSSFSFVFPAVRKKRRTGGKKEEKYKANGEKTHFPIWINFIPIYQDILAAAEQESFGGN
jgi:hypothetical protein